MPNKDFCSKVQEASKSRRLYSIIHCSLLVLSTMFDSRNFSSEGMKGHDTRPGSDSKMQLTQRDFRTIFFLNFKLRLGYRQYHERLVEAFQDQAPCLDTFAVGIMNSSMDGKTRIMNLFQDGHQTRSFRETFRKWRN